ncbi:MAG: hypothetical protein H7210_09825 [Pyrinomonadaceae bacterium]|nr:hypothetical protein [Phycisphaerales bacterium]
MTTHCNSVLHLSPTAPAAQGSNPSDQRHQQHEVPHRTARPSGSAGTRNMVGCLLALVAMLAVCGMVRAAQSGEGDGANADARTATYRRACQLYQQGVEQLSAGPERAQVSLMESASLFRSLIETDSGDPASWNAHLLANAAHASLASGDIGHAVLYYRRAAVLLPLDGEVRRGLAMAHEKAGMNSASQAVLERVASYAQIVPGLLRGALTLAGWALLWIALTLRVMRCGIKAPRWFVGVCGGVAVLGAATFAPWELLRHRSDDAVVIASVTPRQGPDEVNYPTARTEPFKPGTELSVIESRGNWCCVSLNESDRAWVKAGAIARVFSAR